MAVYTLASQNNRTTAKGTNQSSLPSPVVEEDRNFLEGLGYLHEKLAVGFVQSLENAWDYQASGIAKLFGADDWAERQVANDWFGDWYSHPDEWFKPQGGWKVAGDTALGIGTSVPSVALSFIPYAGPIVSVVHAAVAGAGGSLKESYQETGKLGGKEYLYGAMSGGLEGAIEAVSNKLGIGAVGSVFKNIGKSATKSIASRIGVAAVEGFLGEAFEEGVTEIISPYIKRVTYDPNAKNATLEEIGYAALVGGLSGMVMGGAGATVDTATSLINGTKALNKGNTNEIIEYSKYASQYEGMQKTGDETFERLASSYEALTESLAATGGEIKTANQRMLLGDLNRLNVESAMLPLMYKEAANMLANADAYAERLNAYGMKDVDGNEIRYTAEQIREGFDGADVRAALKSNETLRTLAAMSVAGRMMASTTAMTDSLMRGEQIASEADLNYLAEQGSAEEIEALSEAFGIDDWSKLTREELNSKIAQYIVNGGAERYSAQKKIVDRIKQTKNVRDTIPKLISMQDGATVRFNDGTIDIGIARNGEQYVMYDFANNVPSKVLTKAQVNEFFAGYNQEAYAEAQAKRKEATEKRKAEVEELDAYARENVEDYAGLTAKNKTLIRKVIRQARANGLSEADVLMWADMSAHSGLDVTFSKRLCKTKSGKYANGFYEHSKNRIVVNPEATITQEEVLFHELDHALRTYYDGKGEEVVVTYKEALEDTDNETKEKIKLAYGEDADIINDEANAFYAAKVMSEKGYAKALATKKPSIKQRILSFFKDASGYKNEGLSKAAKKYYKHYQKMYAEFSALNKGTNAYEGKGDGAKRYDNGLSEGARTSVDLDYAGYNETLTVQDVNVLRPFPKKQSINDFSSDQVKKSRKWAYKFYKELGEKSPFFRASFGEWRAYQRKTFVRIVGENNNAIFKSGKAKNSDMNDVVISWGRDIKGETINHLAREKASESALNNIGEIIENAIYFETIVSHPDSNAKMPNTAFMHSLYSLYRTNDGKVQLLKIYVEEAMSDNESVVFKRGYQLKDIIKVAELPNSVLSKEGGLTDGKSTTRYSVADLYEFVKTYDNKFTPAPEISPQAAKLLLNRDGTPKIYYHGTKVDFDVFDKAKLFDKFGFYFTEDIREAREYGTPHGYYLTIKNPIDIYSDEYYNKYYRIKDPEERVKALQADGYDGVSSYSHGVQWMIAFEPTQMKSAIDNIGVFDSTSDNRRYSLDLGIETKVLTEMPEKYKPSVKDKAFSGFTSLQISLVNEQAGIEKIGKKLGIKGIEAKVQAARAARNMAEDMLGNEQYRIGANKKEDVVYQGEGLGKIFSHIKGEDEELFNTYLLHWHNISRMTLEERSQAKIDAAKTEYEAKVAEFEKLNKRLQKLVKQKEKAEPRSAEAKTINAKLKETRVEIATARKTLNDVKKAYEAMEVEENKPVFAKSDGTFVTAEESKKIIAEIEKEHSYFKGVAEKVWAFSRNLNQYRVDTGLITQEDFDYLNEKYPYYVPTYRDGGAKGIVPIQGSHDLKVKQTVKTATGSGKDILPIKTIMARQTMETIRAGQINNLAKSLYDASGDGNDYIAVVSRQKRDDLEVNPTEERPKNNQITFYENGEKVTLAVSREIFLGFDGFHGGVISDSTLLGAMNWANKKFKNLVTSYSPAFMLRNPIRDLQDAGLYTKYGAKFAKNYARAGALIKNNSKEWQLYRAMGGLSSSLFDMDKGVVNSQNKWGLTKKEGNLLKKGLDKVEQANTFLEQLPRFAEFLSAIESGVSYEQAILDAADITTNFGRTGKITKILNATIVPFLNPSIQGFSKMIRTVTSVKTAREVASLAVNATILGIAPMVINMLMYGDDEDYKQLRENDKENNFLFKIGDTYIKVPRGRVASALGGLVNRGSKMVKGEDADWIGYAENVLQQVTPVDSMSRTIFSPLIRDLPTNTTWYGTAIEGREFENVAPRDRYDESTSSIAIAIGKVTGMSPKKIHYVLDQYSGVIGDILLPLTSKKAEKDFFTGNFTIDPATSNKLSSDFYKLYDEANYAKSAGDNIAKYQIKYLNKVKKAASELYDEKSAIQNSDLKGVEKLQQTRAIQVMINQIYKTAIEEYDIYTKAFEATAYIDDSTEAGEKFRFTESIRLTQGSEAALESYNEEVYAKYSLIAKSGVSFDDLYYYYFAQKEIESDKDRQGNVIAGSKKKKEVALVNSLKTNKNQKLLLLAASGYSVGDKATKTSLARYIASLNASKDEKAALAELCGFKVKNGRILLSAIN